MTVNREIPPLEAGERAMLIAWLEFQRETLVVKCAGLTDEQLRERSVPPSSLSLPGLVRHMAEEYARHLGHADFIRERIDGSTGI